MDTWRLVDVEVFFTFFWTPFCSAKKKTVAVGTYKYVSTHILF